MCGVWECVGQGSETIVDLWNIERESIAPVPLQEMELELWRGSPHQFHNWASLPPPYQLRDPPPPPPPKDENRSTAIVPGVFTPRLYQTVGLCYVQKGSPAGSMPRSAVAEPGRRTAASPTSPPSSPTAHTHTSRKHFKTKPHTICKHAVITAMRCVIYMHTLVEITGDYWIFGESIFPSYPAPPPPPPPRCISKPPWPLSHIYNVIGRIQSGGHSPRWTGVAVAHAGRLSTSSASTGAVQSETRATQHAHTYLTRS